jgi:hypothetical protein
MRFWLYLIDYSCHEAVCQHWASYRYRARNSACDFGCYETELHPPM